MMTAQVDANASDKVRALGKRVLEGGEVGREEAAELFRCRGSGDVMELMARRLANRAARFRMVG